MRKDLNKGVLKVHRYAIKKVRVQINFQVAAWSTLQVDIGPL